MGGMNCAKRPPNQRRALRPWACFAFATLALAFVPACVQKPTVKLHHAEIKAPSLQGLGMEVFLVVNNTNSYDIQIRNIRATLTLADRYSVPLQFSPNRWLPAGQATIVAVPMSVPWAMVPALAAESVSNQLVPYTVRGSADVTATRWAEIESDNYAVDEQGTIPQKAFADAALSIFPAPFRRF
jgi:hypothetical protein